MRRPSPAIVGSLALHAGVVALALVSWSSKVDEPKPLVNSVPVSIVSEMVIAAAPADNPQPEPSPEDGATAPVEVPPAPVPPEPKPTPPAPTPPAPKPPTPTPTPAPRPPVRPPEKAPAPRPPVRPPVPTPRPPVQPPEKAPATPPRTPPRTPTTPPRTPAPQPGLDLSALAGPTNPSANRGRPPTGQRGAGTAPRAVGRGDMQALGAQVRPQLNCDLVDENEVIRIEVRLNASGRLVRPAQLKTRSSPAASRVLSAISAAVPFDMPAGYEEQDLSFAFNTADFC